MWEQVKVIILVECLALWASGMIYHRTEWIVDLVDDETVSNIGLEIVEVCSIV